MRGVEDYFRNLLVVQGDEYWVSHVLGDAARWFFDTLKNMLTVGLLMAIADKTGSAPLNVLGQVALAMFAVTVLAPVRGWHLDPLHPVKSQLVRNFGMITAKFLITAPLLALIYFEIRPAIYALVEWNIK